MARGLGQGIAAGALLGALRPWRHCRSFFGIFAQTGGDYLVLFALGGGAAVLALAIDIGLALIVPRRSRAR